MSCWESLSPSTQTIMVFSNISFHIDKIYEKICIVDIDTKYIEETKLKTKKRLLDILKHGDIISCQSKSQCRGLKFKKNNIKTEKRMSYFRNEVSIEIYINNIILNLMVFNHCIKIAGCKYHHHSLEVIEIFWEKYLMNDNTFWNLENTSDKTVNFIFYPVMINYDFNLGFDINREKLNILMNDEKYSLKVFMSQYETTGHTNVNIKMVSEPMQSEYDCIEYSKGQNGLYDLLYLTKTKDISYYKKKKNKKDYITFIVFSTSEVILSGKDNNTMKDAYCFFIDTIQQNKDMIKETIVKKNTFDFR